MTPQIATSVFLAFSELLALARELIAARHKEQAVALKPSADAIKAKIDDLLRQALEHEAAQPAVSVYPPPPAGAPHTLHADAQALKDHIDAIFDAALKSTTRSPGEDRHPGPSLPPVPPPGAAVAAPAATTGGGPVEAPAKPSAAAPAEAPRAEVPPDVQPAAQVPPTAPPPVADTAASPQPVEHESDGNNPMTTPAEPPASRA